jgi:serine/threonine-protein kinase
VAGASRRIDARADLYALGCVAYFLITGTLVFNDSSSVAIALKHMKTPPEPPSLRSGRTVPADLERIILKCLEKDPAARPASARDLERMLAASNVPPWTEEDAVAWWARHLPPAARKAQR